MDVGKNLLIKVWVELTQKHLDLRKYKEKLECTLMRKMKIVKNQKVKT